MRRRGRKRSPEGSAPSRPLSRARRDRLGFDRLEGALRGRDLADGRSSARGHERRDHPGLPRLLRRAFRHGRRRGSRCGPLGTRDRLHLEPRSAGPPQGGPRLRRGRRYRGALGEPGRRPRRGPGPGRSRLPGLRGTRGDDRALPRDAALHRPVLSDLADDLGFALPDDGEGDVADDDSAPERDRTADGTGDGGASPPPSPPPSPSTNPLSRRHSGRTWIPRTSGASCRR